jgi:hypothetical protein
MADLTTAEHAELERCEGIIRNGLRTFSDVGNALLTIRDRRLYQEQYTTFEAYCREQWGFAKSQAYRLMESAVVIANLSPIGDIPATESQARELVGMGKEQQQLAWKEATERAQKEERPVKATDVKEAVKAITEPEPKTKHKPIGPPSDGLIYANSAIFQLKQIAKNDTQRKQAFTKVKEWVDEHA